MSGTPLRLTPDDDNFHTPTSDDPWWQETAWFTLIVPERRLSCYVYPWVRPNLGILGGGVMVWDEHGRHPWDALHWDYQWSYPYPDLGDLRDITFPSGLRVQCLEPLTKYRVTYEHPQCSLDVTFDALLPPHVVGGDGDTSGTFAMHLDQQGHVTGRLAVGGEEHEVDCFAIRDRSWGRRVPTPGLHVGYDLATSATSAFVVFSQPDMPGSPLVEGYGYLWRDGESAAFASGSRELERDGVWPTRVVVRARDALGRKLEAVGECVNHMGFQNMPSMMNLVSLVRWDFEGSDGTATEAWGEAEDVWDVERYRPFARATLGAAIPREGATR
jgi:hypothetical protein